MPNNTKKLDNKEVIIQKVSQLKDTVIKEQYEIRKNVFDKMVTMMSTAFGLVAALAWNDAVKSLFEKIFGPGKDQIYAKFWYAFLVSVLAVSITYYLGRMNNQDKAKKKK